MGYRDFEKDMRLLHSDKAFSQVPRIGIHGWIPDDFEISYRNALNRGLNFYQYCREIILDGVTVVDISLMKLNDFLIGQGYAPVKMNGRLPDRGS